MSNTRKLKPSLTKPRILYRCAACGMKFETAADRAGHWKQVPGARLCVPQEVMKLKLGYRLRRGAWYRPTAPRSPAAR